MLLVNTAPVLAPLNNQTIHAGSTLIFTNQASDIDAGQTLAFSLDPGAPPGPGVGAANGIFAWNTTPSQAGSTNLITVRVTDNGTPTLSDAQSFVITVLPPLTLQSILATNGGVTLTWGAIPGTTYIVQYKSNLSDSGWTPLTPGIVATGTTASIFDAAGPTQRFYRVSLPQY
jgi:hypothetical protein